jgi:hypothetical protein
MLEQLIKKDAGKQNPTRIDRTSTENPKRASISVPLKMSNSISKMQKKAAKIPMAAKIAREYTPVLVIACSTVDFFMMFIIYRGDLE